LGYHGDHVLPDPLAQANAHIEAVGDDVGETVVDDALDRDVGIGR
jgi:hypothetical protein